ncbi:YitT family protein [Candidatus Flexifilum breve]|uniref:YitT family protein n=1 Tax=Candidatus Flexifilum breve TaxID=3140694 RepID=UPI0031CC4E01
MLIDIMTPWFNGYMMSRENLLNAIFGRIIGGIGGGIVLAANGTLGDPRRWGAFCRSAAGTTLSSSTLYTDGFVIAWRRGWSSAQKARCMRWSRCTWRHGHRRLLTEGPSVIRTSVIITDHPRELADAITSRMGRGVRRRGRGRMYAISHAPCST